MKLSDVAAGRFAGKVVVGIYMAGKWIWLAVRSCFGGGGWDNDKPWDNDEGWSNG